jgi:hypothetical protein
MLYFGGEKEEEKIMLFAMAHGKATLQCISPTHIRNKLRIALNK